MKHVLVIHLDEGDETTPVSFLGQEVELHRIGCRGDADRAAALIAEYDGQIDAIGLEGMPAELQIGGVRHDHEIGARLHAAAQATPIVDGAGIRPGLERWGVILADRAQPGIFAEKRVLMTPGLNHTGLAQALARHSPYIRYADPEIYMALPAWPGVGTRQTLDQAAPTQLEQLKDAPFRRLLPQPGTPKVPRDAAPFEWADVLAGDIGAIRRYAPARLAHKTVVVEWATQADLDDLCARGVSIAITMMPSPDGRDGLGRWSAATIEAVLVALRADPGLPLSEDTYLDLIAELDWRPCVRYLQPDEAGINRFAFVIHPLAVDFIYKHPAFRWMRILPPDLVETLAAYVPPMYISRIRGGISPATGQRIEGILISLGATPRQMLRHSERFTYKRLNMAARMAERMGARIMGLGAFTKIVGDAGITVAHEADIAVTSGNSLTVAATLEAAKIAVVKMGATDLTHGKVMIIGATGSIGSVCSRLLAQAIYDVVLVSIEPEKLIELKRKIQAETPGAQVAIATRPDELIGDCDLIVTATSAFGQRILDISKCKPGAVICDVSRPADINPAEAALRPDVLVVESGECILPGDVDYGYDIGLPPGVSYACLAEAALLAMEGRFEDYTLGRNISVERVKEIYHLFKKHGFQIAGLTSFGKYVTEEEFARKRALAEALRADPAKLAGTQAAAAAALVKIPITSKGVSASNGNGNGRLAGVPTWGWLAAGAGVAGLLLLRGRRQP
jgi:predicted amino acid dehydrogenase